MSNKKIKSFSLFELFVTVCQGFNRTLFFLSHLVGELFEFPYSSDESLWIAILYTIFLLVIWLPQVQL